MIGLVVLLAAPASAFHATSPSLGSRPALLGCTKRRTALVPRVTALRSIVPEPDGTQGAPAEMLEALEESSAEGFRLPPKSELQKIVPLAIMFFCILFNYTILRDTKDVLVVTAPGGSAEAIPFLKTWVNLPGAIAFTVVYSKMANRLGPQQLFFAVLLPFLAFFGGFAWLIYPMVSVLHPVGFATWLAAALPAGFAAPIAVLQNWTYSLSTSWQICGGR